MIEIKIKHNNEAYLVINGREVEAYISREFKVNSRELEGYGIFTHDHAVSVELAAYKAADLKDILSLRLSKLFLLEHFDLNVNLSTLRSKSKLVEMHLEPHLEKWAFPYNFQEYKEEFENNFSLIKKHIKKAKYEPPFSPFQKGVFVKFELILQSKPIFDEISPYAETIINYHKNIIEKLSQKKMGNSVEIKFDFPQEIRVSCEQYLLYFAHFLKDLGVNVTPSLKEEAGKVLFSVTPTDDREALDKIREALAVYLNLPSSPIVYDESFAAMRLQQQIENLQHSQKMTAREMQLTEKLVIAQSEMIQEKNIIISQKDSLIEQQNKVIEKITSKSIMIDSLENKEELEEIYDGLKIGESKFLKEQLGIHFNPAKVMKTGVNNLFGKGEEVISILESDEETEKNS